MVGSKNRNHHYNYNCSVVEIESDHEIFPALFIFCGKWWAQNVEMGQKRTSATRSPPTTVPKLLGYGRLIFVAIKCDPF
jgi:hypothetical protein